MDEAERQKYEATSRDLRADLKRFEADWASRNNGAKPGRQDIKANPEIAQKYKKYNQVRDILSGKLPPPKPKESANDRKRKTQETSAQTPSKRSRPVETPSKVRYQDVEPEPFETPSSRKLFSPAIPTSIGPTPQRDGRILGLFDLLVENEENNTPSKGRFGDPTEDVKIQATPSKKANSETDDAAAARLGRTPMSTSKRTLFMTPRKPREDNALGAKTPSSVSRLQFTTPSFLRRAPLPSVDENSLYISPAPLRLPRKPLGRSLSSVVAGLRKLEEEALDDDLEALHEAENEANPTSKPPAKKPTKSKEEEVLEPDSQAAPPQLLGGFDDEDLYDSPPEEALGRDGQPLRVYKKKGQKRTTRRVNMRPTRTKRLELPAGEQAEEDAEEFVPETQVDATKPDSDPVDLGSDSEFDDAGEEDEEFTEKKSQDKKAKKAKKPEKEKPEKKEGKVKKAAKKVNELAHANFKRLKLKNHGAKGGPGFGSRFRRRK
ncbi:DNA replication/checkpoint protein [Whalleya microplaca]|nr:DNA replication/checkpoint protein [Whalleya microplaca]